MTFRAALWLKCDQSPRIYGQTLTEVHLFTCVEIRHCSVLGPAAFIVKTRYWSKEVQTFERIGMNKKSFKERDTHSGSVIAFVMWGQHDGSGAVAAACH